MKQKKIPLRTCIACRTQHDKREMLRIVKNSEGEISLDKTGKKAGRGAYICGQAECIKKLRKQNILARVFECPVDQAVYTAIEKEYESDEK